jgi:hypothetical protein
VVVLRGSSRRGCSRAGSSASCGIARIVGNRQRAFDTVTMVLTFVLLEAMARRDMRFCLTRPWFLLWPSRAARLGLVRIVALTLYQAFC